MTESTGVTTLVQEACEQVSVLGKYYHKPETELVQPELQDLKEYFRRPRLIASGTVFGGGPFRFASFGMDSTTIFSTYFPSGLVRLTGVYGVRFKMVFTLQVATTPFNQGILNMCFQPLFDAAAPAHTCDRGAFAALATNLPHVRLDFSQSTMAQLEVPFIYTKEFMSLRDSLGDDLGLLSLVHFLPISVPPGTVSPTYKLLMHLEEMELIGPYPESTTAYVLQAGRKPMNQEFEDEAYPFSSSVSALSRSVKWIARGVPSISSIAGPTSWFLAKTAGAIRSFGWSKPQIQEPMHRVAPYTTAGEANIDVASATMMVAPFASNQLKVDPSFAFSDIDEMSFPFILSRWSQIYRGSITTADATSTKLYATAISPSWFWFRDPAVQSSGQYRPPLTSGAGANSFIPSHVFALSSMFRQWRGGFKFKFTFAKTKMHGGRVLCTYFPARESGTYSDAPPSVLVPAAPAGLPQPFTASAIFDLKDNNIFEFDVPFISKLPYLPFLDASGWLGLTVLDPLQAPNIVSNSVPYVVEVTCLPGFEVAIPRGPRYPAHALGTPKYQSGRVVDSVRENASELTVGESVNSVKQLIMIPKASKQVTLASATYTLLGMPWFYQPMQSPLVPGPVAFTPESFGYGGNIANWYVFARGSTDVHIHAGPGASRNVVIAHASPMDNNGTSATTTPENASAANLPLVVETRMATQHVRFPAYQRLVRGLSTALNETVWVGRFGNAAANPVIVGSDDLSSIVYPRITWQNANGFNHNVFITRNAGDDAMLGFYLGPVPLGILSAVGAGSYDPDCPIVP